MQNVAKTLPGDVDLELRLVAGTLDMDAGEAGALLAGVPDSAFGNRSLRAAWGLMRRLADAGALNMVAFAKECGDSVPDGVDVYRRIAMTVTGANRETLERWAELVKRLGHRRSLVLRLDAALRTAWHNEEANPAEIEAALAEAGRNDLTAFAPVRLPDIAAVAGRQAEYARGLAEAKAAGSSIRFGIHAVDAHCLVVPGYGVVAARTSHGKTAFMATAAFHMLLAGKAPVVFSMEQPDYQFYTRMLCLLMKCGYRAATGLEPEAERQRRDADEILRASKLAIFDGHHTPDQILAKCRRLRDAGRCDAIFIDQLSRLDCQLRKGETKEQGLTRASNCLVDVWKTLDVPLVLLAQLNKKLQTEHPEPSIAHIKDCGSVIEDACWAFVVDRPEADDGRMERLAAMAAKLRKNGEHVAAAKLDCRGQVIISCAKDRNSTMGGIWSEHVEFDVSCGHVGRWHADEIRAAERDTDWAVRESREGGT